MIFLNQTLMLIQKIKIYQVYHILIREQLVQIKK